MAIDKESTLGTHLKADPSWTEPDAWKMGALHHLAEFPDPPPDRI